MNWDQIEGEWQQIKGHAKSKWGKLTDDDITNVAGKRDVLIGKIQTRYGVLKDDAEKQVNAWIEKLSPVAGDAKKAVSKGTKTS